MKKTFKRLFTLVVVLAIAAAAVWFLFGRETAVAFREETAKRQDIETFYTFTGNLQAASSELLMTRTTGKIDTWHFEEGDRVTKDDVIVTYEYGTKVKAPADGTITEILVEEGDAFTPGMNLCRIADHAHPMVQFRVDEYDVHALQKGMKCTVRILATGEERTGTIDRVAVEGTVAGNLAYYDVELTLPADSSLKIGMSCEILVPRQHAKNAVTVSMDAIQYDERGKPFVYRRAREGGIIQQTVLLGINDGQAVEIREGLYEGETVLIPPSFGFDPAAMRQQMMGGD